METTVGIAHKIRTKYVQIRRRRGNNNNNIRKRHSADELNGYINSWIVFDIGRSLGELLSNYRRYPRTAREEKTNPPLAANRRTRRHTLFYPTRAFSGRKQRVEHRRRFTRLRTIGAGGERIRGEETPEGVGGRDGRGKKSNKEREKRTSHSGDVRFLQEYRVGVAAVHVRRASVFRGFLFRVRFSDGSKAVGKYMCAYIMLCISFTCLFFNGFRKHATICLRFFSSSYE